MELELLNSLSQTLLGGELEQILALKDSIGDLAFNVLLLLEDWMNELDRSVLDTDLECQGTIERLVRLRSAATGQSPVEILAQIVHGDEWQERVSEMREQDVFPAWVNKADEEYEPEPDVDDSLPQWADYYPNESDYLIAEYPEVINLDY